MNYLEKRNPRWHHPEDSDKGEMDFHDDSDQDRMTHHADLYKDPMYHHHRIFLHGHNGMSCWRFWHMDVFLHNSNIKIVEMWLYHDFGDGILTVECVRDIREFDKHICHLLDIAWYNHGESSITITGELLQNKHMRKLILIYCHSHCPLYLWIIHLLKWIRWVSLSGRQEGKHIQMSNVWQYTCKYQTKERTTHGVI